LCGYASAYSGDKSKRCDFEKEKQKLQNMGE